MARLSVVLSAALVSLLLWAGSGFAGAAEGRSRKSVRVLHFSDVSGQFTTLGCTPEERGRVDFSSFLFALERSRREGPHLVVAAGNTLGDAPFFEFMLKQGESGIVTVADMLKRTAAAVFVPGPREFAVPYRMFAEFLPDFARQGLPFSAANVSCRTEAGKECYPLDRNAVSVHELDGVRIGIIPVVTPDIAAAVNPANVRDLEFADPVAVAQRMARRLRKGDGVDLVVAVVNLESRPGEAAATMEFARRVEGIDVVVAGGLTTPDEPHPAIRSARIGSRRTLLVGAPRAPRYLGVLTLELVRKGARWRIDDAHARVERVGPFRNDPHVAAVLAQAVAEFCSLGQRALGEGVVEPPMTWSDFARYVMEVMRRDMATDIAMISEESLKAPRSLLLSGAVTAGFLTKAFARHEVVVLSIPGQDLKNFLLARHRDETLAGRLFVAGIEVLADGSIEVNSRTLNPKRRYRVATTDFLAAGGKGYLKPLMAVAGLRQKASGYFLQELLQRFFERNRFQRTEGQHKIHVQRNFDSLWDRPLWELSSGLNASLSNVSIDNPGNYAETQLTSRSPNTGIKGDGQLHLIMSTRDHRFSEFLKLQYGMLQVGEGDFDETQDLVTEELTYSWTRWRNREGQGRFWVPAPLAKAKVETEFSRAPEVVAKDDEGQERVDSLGDRLLEYEPYHHLELTGTLGLEWLFGTKATAGLGYGVRSELLATDGSGRQGLQAGLEVYYQINKLPLYMWSATSGITLDSRFELFYADWRDDRTLKSSGSTQLVATVVGPLSFTAGFDFFLFRTGESDLAYAFDTLFGLAFSYDAAFQQF